MLHRCYGLAPRSRLVEKDGRQYLASDYPLRRFEVNEAAWLVLNVLDGTTPLHGLVEAPARELVEFLEHKADVGLLRASYSVTPPPDWPEVAVIVPAYGNFAGLRRCLEALGQLRYPKEKVSVTVVDDGTPYSMLDELRGYDFHGLTTSWLHLKTNMGPATARNAGAGIFGVPVPERTGLPAPATQLLAFVDSDCAPAMDWLEELVPVLEDPLLGAAGGGVAGLDTRGTLARYEAECASLNMGPKGGEAGRPGSRIPYLPSCNLLVKRPVFDALRGFRDGMRLGEDVDFCWRLTAAGHGLFYHPQAKVHHGYRSRLAPFLNRKRAYASSEWRLRRLHPERLRHPGRLRHSGRLRHPGSQWQLGRGAFLLSLLIAGAALTVPYLPGAAAALIPLIGWRCITAWRNRGALRMAGLPGAMIALLRGSAAEWLQHCRWLLRHTAVLWLPLLVVLPGLAVLAVVVLLLGMAGEWLSKKPGIPVWVFVIGFAGESLAYSFGRLQGEVQGLWEWLRERLPDRAR